MLNATDPEHKIILATLKLAEAGEWRNLSLADIAAEAGVGLSDLRAHFRSKGDILAVYLKLVDDETLSKFGRYDKDERARDRVFDVLMTRFDVMAPHKAAFQGIAKSPQFMPELVRPALSSIRWMLEAAGLPTDSGMGGLQVTSIGAVFQQAFMTWLKDEDPGQAKTMAALDKGLRRAERWTRSVEDGRAAVRRVANAFRMDSGWWKRSGKRPSSKDAPTSTPSGGGAGPAPSSDAPPSIH